MLDPDFTTSRSRHGSLLCPNPQAQAICASPYQIYATPSFAWWNQHHKRVTRSPAIKTQKFGNPKPWHAPPRVVVASGKSLTRHHRFLISRSSYRRTRRLIGLLVRRSMKPAISARIRGYTRSHALLRFLASPPRVDEHRTLLPALENYCWCHLTSPDDIIAPRQQPYKHLHISPSPRQRHVISHVSSVVSSAPRHLADR